MPEWHKVPMDLTERLRHHFHEIAEIILSGRGSRAIEEHFGIPWEKLNEHAHWVTEHLAEFIKISRAVDDDPDRILRTMYTQGFLAGIAFSVEEDHEPSHHN